MAKKILIIDDEPEVVRLLVTELESHGYEVETANDGMAGFEKAKELVPDIVLLDVIMPGWSGFETASRLNAHPKTYDIPIIFITAMSNESSAGKYLGKSRFSYLFKPFRFSELLAILNNVYGL